MAAHLDTETNYPRSNSFLICFQRGADLHANRCAGKIEPIAECGLARRFSSLQELLELLDEELAKARNLAA
ncbi:MAG: hypothetical protein ACOZB0_11690 [Pseudomonadota bacterium]